VFRIDFGNIDGIILSHGHFDHFTGLVNILKRISSSRRTTRNIDVFTHPDAFRRRWAIFPDGKRARFPVLYEQQLRQLGGQRFSRTKVYVIQIMKKSYPRSINQRRLGNCNKSISGYQAKGLVILTGCGHAGVINTINYSKKITGTNKIHANYGRFSSPL
jgi:7,8-dihydropterin-6-yl-methyl-4-(beta-D-ribofuranosyl)aminobenzene 5'-phosphate synthase